VINKESTATLSIYEPSKLKCVNSHGTISESIENKQLDENIKVQFN